MAICPDNDSVSNVVHLISAYIDGFLVIFFILLMAIFGKMNSMLRLLPIQFVIIVSILLLVLLLNKKARKRVFLLEIIFIFEWVTTIFTLAFINIS